MGSIYTSYLLWAIENIIAPIVVGVLLIVFDKSIGAAHKKTAILLTLSPKFTPSFWGCVIFVDICDQNNFCYFCFRFISLQNARYLRV